jgi:monoamine oxidase
MRARTPLTRQLRRIAGAHDAAYRTGVPVDEVLDGALDDGTISRRAVLGGALAGAAALTIGRRLPRAAAQDQPRIVIVGGGGAGVRCAHALWDHGIRSTVYEAADRIGGRMWTLRGFFADDQIGEHGGGFVSSEHTHLRALVSRFGLQLEDVDGGAQRGYPDTFFFDGARYSRADLLADWAAAYPAFQDAARRAPWPQKWDHHTAAGAALDQVPVTDWVERNIPGGTESRFGKLMLTNVLSEYGGPLEQTSALNLIYLLSDAPRDDPFPLDGTDERWHVVGGNDLVVSHMVDELPGATIETGVHLLAACDAPTGRATKLTFERGQHTFDVTADLVVFALPFRVLRTLEVSGLTLSDRKRRAINTMGMGTNLKLHVQVAGSPWRANGRSGSSYSAPDRFEEAWDETVGQPGSHSISLGYLGGPAGVPRTGVDHGAAPAADVQRFLAQMEPLFPGMTAAYRGRAYRDAWALDPWHHGAYSFYRLGQFTGFGGYEGVTEGTRFFCGEHTSFAFQGYMEGAIRSGEHVADRIRDRL